MRSVTESSEMDALSTSLSLSFRLIFTEDGRSAEEKGAMAIHREKLMPPNAHL